MPWPLFGDQRLFGAKSLSLLGISKPLLSVSGISSWKIPLSFLNERGRGLIKPDEIEGLSVYHEGG